MASLRVRDHSRRQALGVAPASHGLGHRQGRPDLVVAAGDEEELGNPLHRDRGGRHGLGRSATGLFVETHERWRVGVGFRVLDEVHVRQRAAPESPVRRDTAV